MRNKPKLDLGLNAFEELFMNDTERVEARLPKIYDIPINLIDDFPEHPFKVRMDDDMEQLIASIKEQGLITPVILRPKEKGRYEMVSGHRRKEACLRAGLAMIKAEVREITHDEAIIVMVDSNLQRSIILPSEKAFSYKMRLEALKRQGKRTDLTSCPVGTRSNQQVGKDTGDSARQVARYVRLTELVPDLLDLVDNGKVSKALFATCLTLGSLSANANFFTYSKQCLALIVAADSQAEALTIGEESRSKGINAIPAS